MRKNFILDTNVLLYDPEAINQFSDNTVIIPIEVIEELDNFKRDMTELGQNSRVVTNHLDQLRKEARLGEGVQLDGGGLLRVFAGECDDFLSKTGLSPSDSIDNSILNLAIFLTETYPQQPTIIVSKSINLRIKADALGIYAEDYEEPRNGQPEFISGFYEILCASAEVEAFRAKGVHEFRERTFKPNEYVLLKGDADSDSSILGRIDGDAGTRLVPIADVSDGVLGVKPLNLGQRFALDALLNDDIKLVTLLGIAGTGKTLLAVAAGLHKVLVEDKYNKLLVSRPTLPMGRDIGYIPGDVDEKMRPWMQPIYDAIDLVREIDRRSRNRSLPPDILESDEIGIESLTYIRGRSIPNQFMIIDEAQNLTPHEVKTIITRVGYETKVVLTGDPHQIDNPYIDAFSNGFAYLIDRFRDKKIAADITLTKGERSDLAEIAANLL